MGCFDATCGISRAAIKMGDKCIIIASHQEKIDLLCKRSIDGLSDSGTILQELKNVSNKEFGEYFSIFIGTYNDYGFIEETINEKKEIFDDIHLHIFAVKILLDINSMAELEKYIKDSPYLFLKNIIVSCEKYRYDIRRTICIGQQYTNTQEIEKQIEIIQSTQQFLEKRLKELKKREQ